MWNTWKKIAARIGDIQATFIFSLLYYVLLTPIGLVASVFKDFFLLRRGPYWSPHEASASTLKKLKSQ